MFVRLSTWACSAGFLNRLPKCTKQADASRDDATFRAVLPQTPHNKVFVEWTKMNVAGCFLSEYPARAVHVATARVL